MEFDCVDAALFKRRYRYIYQMLKVGMISPEELENKTYNDRYFNAEFPYLDDKVFKIIEHFKSRGKNFRFLNYLILKSSQEIYYQNLQKHSDNKDFINDAKSLNVSCVLAKLREFQFKEILNNKFV